MSRTACLLLLALLAIASWAPAGRADDEPATKPGDAKAPAEAVTFVPSVKLIAAGAEPRKALRYKPAVGSKAMFRSSTTMKMTTMMGAMNVGPIKTGIEVSYGKGKDAGTRNVTAVIAESTVEDDGSNPMVSMMKASIEASKGQRLEGEIDGRGIWKQDPLAGAGSAAQQTLRAQLLGAILPLPAEPVGVGAKWSYTVKVFSGNVIQTSVSTIEVKKIEGDRVELAFVEKRSAKDAVAKWGPQEVPVKSLTGKGTGTTTIDLAMGGTAARKAELSAKMVLDFQGQQMEQTSEIHATATGKPAAATTPDK